MKKLGILFFAIALVGGIIAAQTFSFGTNIIPSPFKFVFGEKIHGSGNVVAETRETDDFSAIRVSGAIRVYVEQSNNYSVRVEAEDNILPHVKTYTDDGVLTLKTKGRIKTHKPIKVFVSMINLKSARTSGASYIEFKNANLGTLKIRSSGASSVAISGKAEKLSVRMSGASRIDTSNLATAVGHIRGSGASSLKGNFSDFLNVRVSGASHVKYKGSVETIKKKISGGGHISKL